MTLEAIRCPKGHLRCPPHPRCPVCGDPPEETIDLSEYTATIVTWTTSAAPPPGVREPNHLAIVEFELDETGAETGTVSGDRTESGGDRRTVRAIGGLTTATVKIGDEVRPTYVDELRDPDAGVRDPRSQEWDGYRFEPV